MSTMNPGLEPLAPRAALQMAITTQLTVLQRAYRGAADRAVAPIGLSQAMAWPLVMIGRQGDGLRPGVLAELLAVEPASLVRQLDLLVDAGLVERRDDCLDRRARTLHLTEAGRQACASIEASLDLLRTELFAGLPDADLEACLRVFAVFGGQLGRGRQLANPADSKEGA